MANGEKPGYPRFHGRKRSRCSTDQVYGNDARLENGALVLATIGRSAVRWRRPLEGPRKPVTLSTGADGWSVSFSRAAVPTEPLPLTGQETGSGGRRRQPALLPHSRAGAEESP